MIFTLLNTDLVPTKKLPVEGLVPHTIAGEPSTLTDKLPLEVKPFLTLINHQLKQNLQGD